MFLQLLVISQKVAVKLFVSVRRGIGDSMSESGRDATPPPLFSTDNQLTPTIPIRRLLTTIIRKCCLSISPTDSTNTPFEPIIPNTLSRAVNNFTTTDFIVFISF